MQTCKFHRVFLSTPVNQHVIRTATASAANENVNVNDNGMLKSWREIPGPSSLPVAGSLHHFLPGGLLYNFNAVEMTKKMFKMYGPIVKLDGVIGRPPVIFIFDAESSAQILRGENYLPVRQTFGSLKYYRQYVKKGTSEKAAISLITSDGEEWKKFRSTVSPVLLQPRTVKCYYESIDKVSLDMIARMKSQRDENNMLKGKFDEEINLWAVEAIAKIVLGNRLGCLDPNLPEDSPVRKLIVCVRGLFEALDSLDFRFKPTVWKYISTPDFKRAMALYEEQEDLSKILIGEAVQQFKTKNNSDENKCLLEKMLAIHEEFAYIMAGDLLFGGGETVAVSATAIAYLLAVNPEKQNRLREELRLNGDNKLYLKSCMKEFLRMMPIGSGNTRHTSKEYSVLGYRIPANAVSDCGDFNMVKFNVSESHAFFSFGKLLASNLRVTGKFQVVLCHQDMSMMEEHFPRAKEFLPERWLVDNDDPLSYKSAHPFASLPFGFGVRSCIGRRIANLELEVFTSRLVENFHIEWFGPPPYIEQRPLNYFNGPFNFIFNDAPN